MTWRRQTFSLTALRVDAARFALLCVMLLALPILHPAAEARAAQNGIADIICTQFGMAAAPGTDIPVGAADDSPCAVLCGAAAAGMAFKTLLPASADHLEPLASNDPGPVLARAAGTVRPSPRRSGGIRAPPV